jgi:peptide chain release factor 1
MNPDDKLDFKINQNDITKQYTCSRGKGGQNVNRVKTCVVLTHVPTGTMVRCEETRYQAKNEELAYERLYDKLRKVEEDKHYNKVENQRNSQFGEFGRGEKRRTYRLKEDIIQDHITGKQCRWKDIQKGKIELLK